MKIEKQDEEGVSIISRVAAALLYAQVEAEFALELAQTEIKDPELVKRVEALKLSITSTMDYVASKRDAKRG